MVKTKPFSGAPKEMLEHVSPLEWLGARKGLGAIHWDPVILSPVKQTQGGKLLIREPGPKA